MKTKFLILTLLLFSSNIFAYTSSDSEEFKIKYNNNGAVLISVKNTSKKIYLGKDCDAVSKLYGKGTWAWANGGFIIEFKSKELGFARQEIDIEENGKCRM